MRNLHFCMGVAVLYRWQYTYCQSWVSLKLIATFLADHHCFHICNLKDGRHDSEPRPYGPDPLHCPPRGWSKGEKQDEDLMA